MTVNRAARALGGLTALLALACMVMATTPGASASKHSTPSASARASVGRGVLPAPHSIALSNAQVCGAVAAKGGFSYNNNISTNAGSYPIIVVAVAVALAESGCQWNIYLCNPSLAYGYYPPVSCPNGTTSYDRGLWQINSYYHNEVSDSCAFQVQCNTAAVFNMSNKGRDWSAWIVYSSGAWANYISIAKQAVYGFSFQLENHGDHTCLDADSAQPHDRGTIFQWACNASDKHQRWKLVGTVGHLPILQNVGTGTCLDADSKQIYNRGKIFQWHCHTADPYQQWWFHGSGRLNINGNADAGMHSRGTRTTCLTGDRSSSGDRAPIFQWKCNQSDIYQQWN